MFRFIYRSVLTYFDSSSIAGTDIERPYMNTSMTTTEAFYWSMLMPETNADDDADLNYTKWLKIQTNSAENFLSWPRSPGFGHDFQPFVSGHGF
jgi:hypothetical protein